jgi:hypothetical protein
MTNDKSVAVPLSRRTALRAGITAGISCLSGTDLWAAPVAKRDPKVESSTEKALQYLTREQRRQGYWEANGGQYRVAMTALAGVAFACEGSTTTRGPYSEQISRAVDYLLDQSQPNGLIGFQHDYHYTYGHGFSMLFLSQMFGEEDDAERRLRIKETLDKAVKFTIQAQTTRGGWGYVSAKDGNDFDEGSTCITQVQALRACRNSGIVVPKEPIDAARKYIQDCTTPEGGVQYSIRGGGARPPITAAAIAAMYSAGEYDQSDHVLKMLEYCRTNIWPGGGINQAHMFGHWHYTHFYYSQVMYRHPDEWPKYFADISRELTVTQQGDGAWGGGHVGPVYTTAINAMILQLDRSYLPIYQR